MAQENRKDVVYLKNGSIIKGQIVEQVPNKTITIQILDGSTFVYSVNDIKKITKESVLNKQTTNNTLNSDKHKKRLSYYSFNLGGGSGFKMNLVELNVAGNSGIGLIFKWGGFASVKQDSESSASGGSIGYLVAGPSYSFKVGSTVGTASLMVGLGSEVKSTAHRSRYGDIVGESSSQGVGVFGVGYTHRFFTSHRWNLILGADLINDNFGLNIGFAYNW